MFDRFRIFPAVMIAAALLFALKSVNIAFDVDAYLSGVSPAYAEGAETEDAAETAEAEATAASEGEADAPAAAPGAEAEVKDPAAPAFLTEGEVKVLQSLATRRTELDARAQELDLREQVLAATEKRVEGRISELKEIEARIEAHLSEQDQAREDQINSLVKMYETMKPKDAARILERLDMGVLLEVAERMNARKMAAVLAAMDPVAAQELTVELATRRELPQSLDALPEVPAAGAETSKPDTMPEKAG